MNENRQTKKMELSLLSLECLNISRKLMIFWLNKWNFWVFMLNKKYLRSAG